MTKASPRFWNRIAKRYAKDPIADPVAYQTKLETTQRYFRPDMQVLEVGCGTGTTALIHAPHVAHILAIKGVRPLFTVFIPVIPTIPGRVI